MSLDLTPYPDGFGAKLNRTMTRPEWDRVIAGKHRDLEEALKQFGFLEGNVWACLSTHQLEDQLSRWASTFLHRDNVVRAMVAPKGGRREGTWLLPDDDYVVAQRAGMTALLEEGSLSKRTLDLLEVKRSRLGTEQAENIPIGAAILADRALNYELLRSYQTAALRAKGVRAKKMDWEGGLFTRKLAIMRSRIPHMREVSSALDFSVGGSVGYMDVKKN